MLPIMGEDALDIWRREMADSGAGPPQPPPRRGSIPPPGRRRRPLPRLIPSRPPPSLSMTGFAGLTGAVLGAIVTFAHGWPPGDGLLVALGLIPVAIAGLEYARTRSVGTALGHGIVAGVGGALAAAVIVPAWGFLEFVECWASWLSDC